MYLRIELTDKLKEAIANETCGSYSCQIKLCSTDRKPRKAYEPSDEVLDIIERWNNNATRKQYNTDRNLEVIPNKNAKSVQKVIDLHSKTYLISAIKSYLDTLKRGLYLKGLLDLRYKNLYTLCDALLSGKAWFMKNIPEIDDANPKYTEKLADRFAQTFLGRDAYGLTNPSEIYNNFMAGASKLEGLAKNTGNTFDYWLDKLFECLNVRGYDGVSPKYFNSEQLWKVTFPAYVKKDFGQ